MLAEVCAEKLNTMATYAARSMAARWAFTYTLLPVPVGPICGQHKAAKICSMVPAIV